MATRLLVGTLAAFIMALLCPSPVCADTVHLRHGGSLDGTVEHLNQYTIAIHVGGGRVVCQASEVARIEENDKTGDYRVATINPLAKQRSEMIKEQTGLTRQERDQVRKLMAPLAAKDPAAKAAARDALVKKGREMEIFPFLQNSLAFLPEDQSPYVMEALVALDRERAAPVVAQFAENGLPGNRTKALEIMSKAPAADEARQGEVLALVARGLHDDAPAVRLAAARGLGELRNKRATPVLIEGLDSTDRKVRNACQAALTKLWGGEPLPAEKEAWQGRWVKQRRSVADPLDPGSLEPLYNKAEEGEPAYYLTR